MVRPITDHSIPGHRPTRLDPWMLNYHLDGAAQSLRETITNLRLAAPYLAAGDATEQGKATEYLAVANHLAAQAVLLGNDAAHWQRASDAEDARRRAR